MNIYDAVVVGAGSYGLSTAAHLIGQGLHVAVFGKPLELWREHMPKGMLLRTHWWATNLSDPQKKHGAEQFAGTAEYQGKYPVPIESFIEYGLWFQKNAVPNLDETYVSSIEHKDGQFLLMLADGRLIQSQAVIMATGLSYFADRPPEYHTISPQLVSHSSDHHDFSRFSGKQVAIIGGGQSAVEYAALLHEANASAHLIPRRPITWLGVDRIAEVMEEAIDKYPNRPIPVSWFATHGTDRRPLLEKIRMPQAGIAPGWREWIIEYFPYFFHYFSQERKDRYLRSNYNAAANIWLKDRVIGKVTLHEGQRVEKIREENSQATLTLSDNETLQVDHVMCATGYRVNIERLPMLSPSLQTAIAANDGIPILNKWFESSIPRLYFVGLPSVRSFGPLYRFVVGTKAAAPRVAHAIARQTAHKK